MQPGGRVHRFPAFAAAALAAIIAFVPESPATTGPAGLRLAAVAKNSSGWQAGLREDDLLLAWSSETRSEPRPLTSPFDLLEIEIEHGPRGAVQMTARRGKETFTADVAPGSWGLTLAADPAIGDEDQEARAWYAYRTAEDHLQNNQGQKAVAVLKAEIDDRSASLDVNSRATDPILLHLQDTLVRALIDQREFSEAIQVAQITVAARDEHQPDSLRLAYSLSGLGIAQQTHGEGLIATETHNRALDLRRRLAPGSLAEADTLVSLTLIAGVGSRYSEAADLGKEALAIQEELAPESKVIARTLMLLGATSRGQGDLEAAETFLRRAIGVQELVAPDSAALASSLDQLGIVRRYQGHLDEAEVLGEQALALHRRLTPGSTAVAATLNSLGILATHRGDLASSQNHHTESLQIHRTLSPGGVRVAQSLNNLGYVASERGDLITAEKCLLEAVEIYRTNGEENMDFAGALLNLGVLAARRNDLVTAEKYYRQSLDFCARETPGTMDEALALADVGRIVLLRGEFAEAETMYRRAFTIHQKLNPESLEAADTEIGFGLLAWQQGDLKGAEQRYQRGLAIQKTNSPSSVRVADSLYQLGRLAHEQADIAGAEAYVDQALAISRRLVPGSAQVADAAHLLGVIQRDTSRPEAALQAFKEAVEALETQRSRLGGSEEARSGWAAQYADYYRDYIDLLNARNRPGDAFTMLEHSRARGLLAMLAERDLVLGRNLPRELELQRLAVNRRYDNIQHELMNLDTERDKEAGDQLMEQLRETGRERDEIIAAIRRESPRLAALRYPQPMDATAAQAVLDPGTLLLAWSIGRRRSLLFALPAAVGMDGTANGNGLQVYALQVGRAALEEKVLAFRATIRRESQADSDALPTMAAELYDLLVAPAEDLAAASQRLLLSPDGPLHTLPFNALLRDLPDGKTQYLIQWKPMHTVLSATLYRELRRNRENPPAGLTNNQGLDSPRAITMTAFGDPRYPAGAAGEGDTATLDEITRGRRELQPLPWSRTEVKQIAALFPEDHARTYLGPRATEDAVMSATSSTRLVHFACHAILDERFPLNSALVLSIPAPWSEGQPNGLLQSWEIFESLRLDADLVTLSGCDTALGAQVEGEGLSSLSRAFLHAGAQSVLASLWSVADQSTAELMTRFYTHLQGGKTKDEALQAAQIDLLRGAVQTDTSSGRGVSRLARTGNPSTHPFYWAAFQLIGDWR